MHPIKDFRLVLIQFNQFIEGKLMWLILVVILLFGITACNSRTDSVPSVSTETAQPLNDISATLPVTEPSIYFPTQEPVDGEREVMEALLFGNLTVVDKCIWVITDDGEPNNIYLIIWPPNFTLNSGTEPAQIINDNGNVVASIGDDVRLSGGEHRRLLDPSVSEALPPICLGGPYWIVGEEISTIEP